MKISILISTFIFTLTFSLNLTVAQTWSTVGTGTNSGIYGLETYNGKLYATGLFTQAGGNAANYIARWDGLVWTSIMPGFGSWVSGDMLHEFNGFLYAGVSGVVAKWNDTSWTTYPNVFNSNVWAIGDYNGTIYTGGAFTQVSGISRSRIARWDTTLLFWDSVTTQGCNGVVNEFLNYNGKLYVVGQFGSAGGKNVNHVAIWNDTTFIGMGGGTNDHVFAIIVYNNEIYIAGRFTQASGNSASRIAKWNGTQWVAVGPTFNGFINCLAVYNGELYVGGQFTSPGNRIMRFNGTTWNTLGTGLNNTPQSMEVFDNALYVGGLFTMADGNTVNHIAKWSICNSTTSSKTDTACNSYIWNNNTYTASGTYIDTIPNAVGCDSIMILNLTINNSTISSQTETACNSYIWNNNTYTVSGTYRDTIPNVAGCDSILTLYLTINENITSSQNATACNSYIWNNNTYTVSGTYMDTIQNVAGCDSIMTLNLTIKNSTISSKTDTACNSYIWNNNTYSTSGTYIDTISNVVGCDSIMTLNLTIYNATTGIDLQSACFTYTWIDGNTYTASNNTATFNIVGGAANGCDSMATLNLTINTVDNSITDNSPTLTSNAVQATYQWLDCNNGYAPVSGETNQSFIATVNGNYAVEVSQNSCTDTSKCIAINNVGIEGKQSNSHNLSIYPNPSHGIFTVEYNYHAPVQIEVLTIHGKRILKSELTENSNVINLSAQPAGMYIIKVSFGNSQKVIRRMTIY
jgi:hypothetical protein